MAQAILKQQASGFRIAPPTHSVKPWYGNWRTIHSAICTVASNPLAVIELDTGDRIFVDEKFATPRHWYFAIKGCQRPIAGYALVLGPDRDGCPAPTRITLNELKTRVLHLQLIGSNTFMAWSDTESDAGRPPRRMTSDQVKAWMQAPPQPSSAPAAPSMPAPASP